MFPLRLQRHSIPASQKAGSPATPSASDGPRRKACPGWGGWLLAAGLALGAATELEVQTAAADQVLPSLEVSDMSLAEAIDFVVKSASVNVLVDPRLSGGQGTNSQRGPLERTVSARYEQVSGRQVIEKLAREQRLAWHWNPVTQVGRLSSVDSATDHARYQRIWDETLPAPLVSTNVQSEFIQEDTPLLEAVTTLVREIGVNCLIDPVVSGRCAGADGKTKTFPSVRYNLFHVTQAQVLVALLENHELAFVWNPETRVGRVTTAAQRLWELDHPLNGLPAVAGSAAAKSVQPLLILDEAPLGDAIQMLAKPSGLNLLYSPSLRDQTLPGANLQTVVDAKLRSISSLDALLALLEHAGLALFWNPRTAVGRVLTKEQCGKALASGSHAQSGRLLDAIGSTNVVAQIAFDGVPADVAFGELARLGGFKVTLPPEAAGDGTTAQKAWEVWADFERLTAPQALLALAEDMGFGASWDAGSKTLRLTLTLADTPKSSPPAK